MLDPLATLADFALRVPGGVQSADEGRATAALQDASALVRTVAGVTADDWLTTDDTVPDIVQSVVIAAAKRAFVKPDMVASETIIAYTASFTSGPSSVFLTKSEERSIRRAGGSSRSALWVQPTTRSDLDDDGFGVGDVPAVWPPGGVGFPV